MKRIRKRDVVALADGSFGRVVKIVTTNPQRVLKVESLNDNRVEYFDESKLMLKKQTLENRIKDLIGFD
jgi:hypothetical protein